MDVIIRFKKKKLAHPWGRIERDVWQNCYKFTLRSILSFLSEIESQIKLFVLLPEIKDYISQASLAASWTT